MKLLLNSKTLRMRVGALSTLLTHRLRLPNQNNDKVVAVVVMDGAFVFAADLLRQLPHIPVYFLRHSSYEGQLRTHARINADFEGSALARKDVLIVEDIVDTGLTLSAVEAHVRECGARSIVTVSMLDKPACRVTGGLDPDYYGFKVEPDQFVVGYGMDLNGAYRGMADIWVM